ncbi:MAG: hypothetical protein HQK86_03210 [Nitrospinae bacterium]|nr:hypothetical protein [Nitrospinota bacterium]
MPIQVRSFVGRGPVRISTKGANNYFPLWNCQKLDLATESQEDKLMDAMSPAGGVMDSATIITGAQVGMTSPDYHPDTIARVLWGSNVLQATAAVTAETHASVKQGSVVKLNFTPSAVTTVKDGTGVTTYVLGTDYNVTGSGVEIITGSGIADASTIKVDYTKADADVVHALTTVGAEFSLLFEGINTQSGKNVIIEFFRVRFSAAKSLQFQSVETKFGKYDISAFVLADESRPAGESKYFTITYVN